MKRFLLAISILVGAAIAPAQDLGHTAIISDGPDLSGWQVFYTYVSGANTNVCYALSTDNVRLKYIHAITGATAANPGVFTSTDLFAAFPSGGPKITIVGGTGNWAAANGTWIAVFATQTTFSIYPPGSSTPLNTTTFGAVTGTLTFTTTAPALNNPVWASRLLYYNGTSQLVSKTWQNAESYNANVPCPQGNAPTTPVQSQ